MSEKRPYACPDPRGLLVGFAKTLWVGSRAIDELLGKWDCYEKALPK